MHVERVRPAVSRYFYIFCLFFSFSLSLSLSVIARNKTKVGESDGGMEGGRRKNGETGAPGVVVEEDEGGEEEKSARRI